ncbi:succinylglutamate desuccinylase [Halomonas sp. A11-A]|uniref:succinylglutamate desuccinylase n=1 Tax=Halomonas sp. A11-A TaxID=2183985 RepID=UPI000D708F7A|nr:succinylglutamate desuccinylase [Halomonas sp. A11-A]PWV75861.1 succinylglutamate desuccinylase [Halomonas sp. A11-A]
MSPSRPPSPSASRAPLATWLWRCLEGEPIAPFALPGGSAVPRGEGVLELVPERPAVDALASVVSVGIHGDETAPIELLQGCLERLAEGQARLGAPVLLVLGNPEATRQGVRYVGTNLNRLFRRELDEQGMEPDRARTLMAAVDAFFARHGALPRLHYDLHTAIRDSRYPRFVVSPFTERTPVEAAQWHWLAAADIQAVLLQHRHSWTFSHYSKHYHGAQAFTLELGRALPFGHNDLAPLAPMGVLLAALLEGREPPAAAPERMAFFRVAHELMRESVAFRLAFPDDTPNFTTFPPGTLLAEDGQAGETRVGEAPLAVVFPNAEVEIGARAALLVHPEPPPSG